MLSNKNLIQSGELLEPQKQILHREDCKKLSKWFRKRGRLNENTEHEPSRRVHTLMRSFPRIFSSECSVEFDFTTKNEMNF